ncbi:MAG: threonylcarbamoyl-AMP synthase [Hadesarchaea archaeon]|nr:MAG: threonylcarbamoyl-AMP synthase [Hadesarchaea archaeon]
MKTIVLRVDPANPEPEKIALAAEKLREGGLVAFPTETVYGLGADALNPKAMLSLFEAKKRPLDNPPIVHIGEQGELHLLAREVPSEAEKLAEKFWPGPLTLVLKRSPSVPSITTCGLETIAIRMPKHEVALALIRRSGTPIAAPSANLAGRPSPTRAEHVLQDLEGRIDLILDAGPTPIGVESTVLDLTVQPPQILRPGGTPKEALEEVLGEVVFHPSVLSEKEPKIEKAKSPGMKYRHYAPKAEMWVVEGEPQAVEEELRRLSEELRKKGKKVGILATEETLSGCSADATCSLGRRGDLEEAARRLFGALRELDTQGVEIILAEGMPLKGLGVALVNRLRKASGYRIVKV